MTDWVIESYCSQIRKLCSSFLWCSFNHFELYTVMWQSCEILNNVTVLLWVQRSCVVIQNYPSNSCIFCYFSLPFLKQLRMSSLLKHHKEQGFPVLLRKKIVFLFYLLSKDKEQSGMNMFSRERVPMYFWSTVINYGVSTALNIYQNSWWNCWQFRRWSADEH